MEETLDSLPKAFLYKLSAFSFFYKHIAEIYQPNTFSTIPNELFYYLDACIFELHAASQILLQQINIKSGKPQPTNLVSWNEGFKKHLKSQSQTLYKFWEEIDDHPVFGILEAARQHIAHRGNSELTAELGSKNNITILSFPHRYRFRKGKAVLVSTGSSIELLDELLSIEDFLKLKFGELQKL